ncbi:MAG: glycosyltransferase family 4 protein [Chloroflexi bacterium]|nr:glycosyltransferase family 4 protein [Chloroflexota bacterium]
MKNLRISLYCPDHHLAYDGRTPDKQGVGGGVAVRIRLAAALAKLGHDVAMICNCSRVETVDGVKYLPLAKAKSIDADVLILSSSGGDLDLRPALNLEIKASLRLIWVHGTPELKGLREIPYDYVCMPSNFIRQVAMDEWGVPREKLFVSHHGVSPAFLARPFLSRRQARNPYKLVYTSHPSKGIDSALGVLRVLRAREPRFELHFYGGNRLWGEAEQVPAREDGVIYHGLLGQQQLAHELQSSHIALNLQDRLEPFGLSLIEAMASGNVVFASAVGAYPEILRNGYDGFLVHGNHMAEETWQTVARQIQSLTDSPDFSRYIRNNAQAAVRDWETVAQTWLGHWEWAMGGSTRTTWTHPCPTCGGAFVPLADGYHCASCGLYSQDTPSPLGRGLG